MPASKTKNAGTGTVIISSPDATATYTANSVTVTPKTHSNVTLTAGSGLTYTTGTGVQPTWAVNNGSVTGTMHAKDLMLDGVSLKQLLEERLNLMVPNPELEKEWNQLKTLGDEYRRVEADLKEKAAMWRALKAEDR